MQPLHDAMSDSVRPPSLDRRRFFAGTLGLALASGATACLAPRRRAPERPGGWPRHRTLLFEQPRLEPDAAYGETEWIPSPLRFDQALASWNVDVPDGSGAVFSLQVRDERGRVSPWLEVGSWGEVDPDRPRTAVFEGGRMDVDTLVLDPPPDVLEAEGAPPWVGASLRLRMRSVGPGAARLRLLALTVSDRQGRFHAAPQRAELELPPAPVARLSVPFRSQRAAAPGLRERLCSPTSVAMVLASAERATPLLQVAAQAYHPDHDLYGVWPRNVQAAYALGLPGFLTRLEGWAPAHRLLSAGIPLVISVKAGPGELRGAPYASTDGHLLVLSGVDAAGDLLVHDPAAADIFAGVTTYAREDLERCWLRNGGTAYVFSDDPSAAAALLTGAEA